MNTIKTINISGIRGVRKDLILPLDKKSILIYGDNGVGKSSISDAFEWFYSDGIGHLAGEEVGGKGKNVLRNVFLDPGIDAKIEIKYSDSKIDCEKSINKDLKIFSSNSSKEFSEYYTKSQSENLILRYRDLLLFVTATKGDKLKYLQEIIGYGEVQNTRGLLKLIGGRLSKDIRSGAYSNKKSTQQAILLECLGQNITSTNQFYQVVQQIIEPLKLNKEVKSFSDIKETLKLIATNEENKVVEQITFQNKIGDVVSAFELEIESLQALYLDYYDLYTSLRKDSEKIKGLQLLSLITEGVRVLNAEISQLNFCPLCQQEKDKVALLQELNLRLDELKEVKEHSDKLTSSCENITKILKQHYSALNNLLKEKPFVEEENKELKERIEVIKKSIEEIGVDLKKTVFAPDPIKEPTSLNIKKEFSTEIAQKAKATSKELTDDLKGNLKLQIHTKLSRALDAYLAHLRLEKEEQILIRQQNTFEALYTDFIKRQEQALNGFLTSLSNDINTYYSEMNPDEKVDDIKLIPIKDKNDELSGITIEYSFFNKRHTPPTALLSESHINCLGLSFFLASVTAFNKTNKFFVLDDVISSFDAAHRARFMRLLISKFNDYQIILLTHERDFFDLASSEAKRKNWIITSMRWDMENGTSFEVPTNDLRAKILEKVANNNIDGLGNDIRKYTERQLKNIAFNIEAPVAFRFNNQNEERMMNELLSSVQSKVNSKSPNDLKTKYNIDNLFGFPILIGNKASHDNDFKENINDLKLIWDDVIKLLLFFYCSEQSCKSFVSMKNYDSVEQKIRCNCGKVSYAWKK